MLTFNFATSSSNYDHSKYLGLLTALGDGTKNPFKHLKHIVIKNTQQIQI